jgi:hypothetical protein
MLLNNLQLHPSGRPVIILTTNSTFLPVYSQLCQYRLQISTSAVVRTTEANSLREDSPVKVVKRIHTASCPALHNVPSPIVAYPSLRVLTVDTHPGWGGDNHTHREVLTVNQSHATILYMEWLSAKLNSLVELGGGGGGGNQLHLHKNKRICKITLFLLTMILSEMKLILPLKLSTTWSLLRKRC